MPRQIAQVIIATLLLIPALTARAQSDCYTLAQTYYEQLYCDVQAQSRSHGLPPIYEFKRNDATTQALLLRRPAQRLGIDVPMPTAKDTRRTPPPEPAPAPSQRPTSEASDKPEAASYAQPQPLSDCTLVDTRIQCAGQQYQLLGNQSNSQLAPGALQATNKMDLPVFDGDPNDQRAVQAYLHQAYQRYVEQMLAIGLGGVTMTYGRFAFLFEDIQSKGLDFSDRFETMYRFLKKDKASMSVDSKPSVDKQLKIEDCDPLSPELLVCSRQGRNHVFKAK